MKKKKSINFLTILLLVGLIPAITSVCILGLISVSTLKSNLVEETYIKLETAANGLASHYSVIDWDTEEKDHSYVDSLQGQDIHLTLFHEDVRFVTSLKNESGERIEGTKADATIYDTVQHKRETYTAQGVNIVGDNYYVCYLPLEGKDGMAFAGISEKHVTEEVRTLIVKIMVSVISLTIFWAVIVVFVAIIVRRPLRQLADALSTLASGFVHKHNNIHTIATETINIRDAYDTLQRQLSDIVSSIQNANNQLQSDMLVIDTNTDQTAASTEEITSTMHEVAQVAQSVAESVQEIGADIDKIGNDILELSSASDVLHTTSKIIAEACKETTDAMTDMANGNKNSMRATEDIIACIDDLCQSVDGINTILAMIKSVADQTKLLSLNASIEAARAGEAGRGFAVVATEIQNLSNQSNEGVEQISELATTMLQKSQEAMRLSENIGNTMSSESDSISHVNKTFEKLYESIDKSLNMIADMQSSVTEINQLKDAIVGAVEDLSAASEQSAASNQEVTATIETVTMDIVAVAEKVTSMRDVTNSLDNSIKIFK